MCEEGDEDSAARSVCLLCGTILADGQLRNNTAFRAEAMGKLTITILLQCLYDFIGRTPTILTLHTCDNQALVKRVNNLRDNNNFHTINNPIDGNIIVPTAYWVDRTNLMSKWVRGHAERRKTDVNEWTDDEWANDITDMYADRAWHITPRIHCSTIAISFLHHTSLQIQVPGGSMSGKIARRLADDINRRRGLQQL